MVTVYSELLDAVAESRPWDDPDNVVICRRRAVSASFATSAQQVANLMVAAFADCLQYKRLTWLDLSQLDAEEGSNDGRR